MSELQWEQLKTNLVVDKDGLIFYTKFLELFDITYVSSTRKSNVQKNGKSQTRFVLILSATNDIYRFVYILYRRRVHLKRVFEDPNGKSRKQPYLDKTWCVFRGTEIKD